MTQSKDTFSVTLLAWKKSTPPPSAEPDKFNVVLDTNYDGKIISGVVAWVPEIQRYAFYTVKQAKDGIWDLTTLPVTEYDYIELRDYLRKHLFVYATRGLEIVTEAEIQFERAAKNSLSVQTSQ